MIGIAQAVKRNIEEFLVKICGFAENKASSLRVELFKTYGSTLAGLRALGHDIDADDYHSFVHGRLPYELIKPDLELKKLLRSIKQRKMIFTNSDRDHAMKVLNRLGLEDCFDQIICFETMNPNLSRSTWSNEYPVVLKPSLDAMTIALRVAQINPCRSLFLDDNVHNIAAGKAMGLQTCLVGKTVKSKEADYVLETVNNLEQVIPEIWACQVDGQEETTINHIRTQMETICPTSTVCA